MTAPVALSDSRLANIGSQAIAHSWTGFSDRFRIITRRARLRFEARDWQGIAADHVERLDLYSAAARHAARTVTDTLGDRVSDKMVWAGMKAVYSGLIATRPDRELAETFFNSVTRRIFDTAGVDPRIEFVDTDYDEPVEASPVVRTYRDVTSGADLVERMMMDSGFEAAFRSIADDASTAGELVERRLVKAGGIRTIDRAEVVDAVFYRGKAAHVVGRITSGTSVIPIVLVLLHDETGIYLDAVLLTENQASIVFSFTRSYFSVDVESPQPLVHFLSSLMPRKRIAELYTSIGHNKHGKTELYRQLRRHMLITGDHFSTAPGTAGLVMVVFTLPGFDVVFKVIRDRFGAPKQLTRDRVRNRYRLVFRHDRAGRLVDAQEFEHLAFDRSRFDDDLLTTLAGTCSRTVMIEDDTVTIGHAYVERRVTPLDIFIQHGEPEAVEEAIIDYGQAIKDMAASGIFPGDMLLKNFGVTRHGRVVFYDYDELTTLDECTFRELPPALDDEVAAEPWFSVGPCDVFPEEFERFLGLSPHLRDTLLHHHGDLFQASTWRRWQDQVAAGEIIEIFPYRDDERLASRAGS
jgi:isocitrate dehydrogenase kinase/phosphatase